LAIYCIEVFALAEHKNLDTEKAVLHLPFVRPGGVQINGKYHAAAGEKAFVCGTA
jgi:hypothetical protein